MTPDILCANWIRGPADMRPRRLGSALLFKGGIVASRSAEPAEEIRRRILDLVEEKGVELVAAYYEPEGGFAGSLFDDFGDNPADRFTADDFVAASLLDVRFGPASVRALLVDRGGDTLLAQIPNSVDVALWNTDLGPDSAAWKLWSQLVAIDEVGPTRASKLLARKRPHLLPILDSVITESLGLGTTNRWAALSDALDLPTRTAIAGVGERSGSGDPSILRLLDVLTWMRFSESDRARAVRSGLGFDVGTR